MEVTVIGPNLRDQSKGTFHVHAAGCADIARNIRTEPMYAEGHTADYASLAEACDDVYPPEQFDCESGEYVDEFHVFPCAASLPLR